MVSVKWYTNYTLILTYAFEFSFLVDGQSCEETKALVWCPLTWWLCFLLNSSILSSTVGFKLSSSITASNVFWSWHSINPIKISQTEEGLNLMHGCRNNIPSWDSFSHLVKMLYNHDAVVLFPSLNWWRKIFFLLMVRTICEEKNAYIKLNFCPRNIFSPWKPQKHYVKIYIVFLCSKYVGLQNYLTLEHGASYWLKRILN